MVKHHRLSMKEELHQAFGYFKNIPEIDHEDNLGSQKFEQYLNSFKAKYSKSQRKTKLSEEEKLKFIEEQGNKSSLSEAPIFLGDDIEVDHIEPLAIGGSDEKDNLGIAHQDENRSKGASSES